MICSKRGRRAAGVALGAAVMGLLSACVTTPRAELVSVEPATECVVLLHGLNRSWRAMDKMASGLQEAGYTTANVDYPSQAASVEGLAPLAVDTGAAALLESGVHGQRG